MAGFGFVLEESPNWCLYTVRQIHKRRWFKIYLIFVCIQILTSCGLFFLADCLIASSNLLFLNILFKSFRILTAFNVLIFVFTGLMLYRAGHTVKCWTFLCSLKVSWTSLDYIPSAMGLQKSKIHAEVPLMVVEILTVVATSIGWVRKELLYRDTENTVLSQKSIWDLLSCTQLIPGDVMNLIICESLQNWLFMQKQNQKSIAFGGFFVMLDFSWEMC